MNIAKLFHVADTQVVYTIREDDEGKPQVECKTYANGVHVAMSPGWEDDDAGWNRASEFLESRTLEAAEDFHKQAILMLEEAK